MGYECTDKNKYEVLAPAGSYKCMVAAFNAGADAVYLGGNLFGARASADNFSEEELIAAIDYAHIRGKKIFLTVNTLLKNVQIKNQLYNYIKPLYEAGLDAVIVQDFGVMEFIKANFPDIDIHASTQMTVTGVDFAKELKRIGVSRIVPARELSCEEVKDIYSETNLEIECFVHGALCYCYSGMCLLSSIIGGRSGNRGRCAQPCRLPYDVLLENENITGQYPLSPADLCTLNILPDILEAGVYSLKIEGRMKKPEYVASVTAMYRKYVDMYIQYGRKGYKVQESDIQQLKDIYNRGDFTDGYYRRHNGAEIMSTNRPNHTGTRAAKIIDYNKNKGIIRAKACEELYTDDVLEIFLGNGESVNVDSVGAHKDQIFETRVHGPLNRIEGYIMRTRNNKLISEITSQYIDNNACSDIKIGGAVVICKDMPITVDVWVQDAVAHIEGDIPLIAEKRPISQEDIVKQITKTGGTGFVFDREQLSITMDDGLFVNIKELNRLRREVLDMLAENILLAYRRTVKEVNVDTSNSTYNIAHNHEKCKINAYVTTLEQFNVALESSKVDIICFEADIVSEQLESTWNELACNAHNKNKDIFMCLPYIFRNHGKAFVETHIDYFKSNSLDGYVFRNMEELCMFENEGIDCKKIIFDNTVYAFNDYAVDFLKGYKPYLVTASYELNSRELNHLHNDVAEICVYGNIPVMVTAGCVKKTYGKCNGKKSEFIIRDRLGNLFKGISSCTFCYNVLYNNRPLWLADIIDMHSSEYVSLKYSFTTENAKEVSEILSGDEVKEFTRGHYKRGVE